MEYKRLGKTDLKVSIIGLGCEGFMNKSDDEVKVLVDKAHQEGINFIDFFSSNPQGRSAFGNAIINHRQDWIIQGDRQQDHFQYGSLHLFSLRNY